MTAQDMIEAARLVRVRELQTALTKAAAENGALRAENEMLRAHFDLALLAAGDLAALPQDPAQAFQVVRMFPGHDDKGCAGIFPDFVQGFPERPADHPLRAGFPGFFGKFLPVLNHGHLIAEGSA